MGAGSIYFAIACWQQTRGRTLDIHVLMGSIVISRYWNLEQARDITLNLT